jgi:hypothetical protein
MLMLDLRYDFWSWGVGAATVTDNVMVTARFAKTMALPAIAAQTAAQPAAFTKTIGEPAGF